MNELRSELLSRELPPLKSREEMMEIMQREVYGYLPKVDYTVSVSEPTVVEGRFCYGTVQYSYVTMTIKVGERSHSFRIDRLLHTDGKRRPLILHNNFHPMAASHYFAMEEMSEYDADFLLFCYKDITSDNGDFENGIAPMLLPPEGRACPTAPGKIMMWAFAAMRVVDYGLTLPGTDPDNIAIAGHSRLGKTASVTAMMDERIKFALANASGCAGDALYRGNTGLSRTKPRDTDRGELIEDIYKSFPFWFCANYAKYAETNVPDCFDQHYLIASIAPRFVMIGSCDGDAWADPRSQQLCALAASEAWEKMGLAGLCGERFLDPGEVLSDGRVGYFLVHSLHFLSRHCWRNYLGFIEKHRAEKV